MGVSLALQDLAGANLGTRVFKILFGALGADRLGVGSTAGWPPLLGFGQGAVPLLMLGVSFLVFMIIPQTADIIKSVIEKRPFTFGAMEPIKRGWELTGLPAYTRGLREDVGKRTLQTIKTGMQRNPYTKRIADKIL